MSKKIENSLAEMEAFSLDIEEDNAMIWPVFPHISSPGVYKSELRVHGTLATASSPSLSCSPIKC